MPGLESPKINGSESNDESSDELIDTNLVLEISPERKRAMLDRFTRISLTNGMFAAYTEACMATMRSELEINPRRLTSLHNAKRAELPLYPLATYRKDNHIEGYMVELSRYDPDTLEPYDDTNVQVATYVVQYLGETKESMNKLSDLFTEEQARLVTEYALDLVRGEEVT